jgi:murein DD-endopeptidase MepM/ murein hydrolase activator NlpD
MGVSLHETSSSSPDDVRRCGTIFLIVPFVIALTACPHRSVDSPKSLQLIKPQVQEQAEGFYHVAMKDEPLADIARTYNWDFQQLASLNGLQSPYIVKANTRILIPNAARRKGQETSSGSSPAQPVEEDSDGLLLWPVLGKVVSPFGSGKGAEQNGITIEAPEGTPVRAATKGKVGHVGKLAALGNVVLIEHSDHLVTVYAHLKSVRTSKGKSVIRGDIIGWVGASGRAAKPSLYFEVRSRSKPKNPLSLLEQKE